MLRLPPSVNLQQATFFAVLYKTLRRRPPSGWAGCQYYSDGAQTCADCPVSAHSKDNLGIVSMGVPQVTRRSSDESGCHTGQVVSGLNLNDHVHILLVQSRRRV